jgi:hypothetical protein
MKYWEIASDKLSAAGWSWGCLPIQLLLSKKNSLTSAADCYLDSALIAVRLDHVAASL